MKKLRENGVSIIFISHRLNEIQRVSDRITILRDGKWIGTSEVRDLSQNDIVKMMVGREVEQSTKKQAKPSSEVILQIKNLSSGDDVHEVTFDLHKGEILGIAGLVGAGRSALAEAVFGSRKITSGYMKLGHKKVKFTSPKMAIEHGLGLVPEDRKAQGLFLNMAVWQNIVIAGVKKTTRFGFIRKAETQKISTSLVDRLSIKTPSLGQQVKNLSGGNQQKVIIARWLSLKPKILILDEPTRGIDVGAKAEIHNLLKELATEGVGVLMISSELPEILGVSDRILVMKEGHLVAVLDPELSSQDEIMQAAAGSKDENIKED
jgi:ribose transport system ATP-binding protein